MIKAALSITAIISTIFISMPLSAEAVPKKVAAAAGSWDGTWSGLSSFGRRTTVKIANGKVVSWINNGYPRPKVTGSVNGNSVSLDDNNSWKATMTPIGEGKARLSAAGIGNDGKPGKNTSVLTKN